MANSKNIITIVSKTKAVYDDSLLLQIGANVNNKLNEMDSIGGSAVDDYIESLSDTERKALTKFNQLTHTSND